jgi:disulfide bond formation protein DsbB
MRATFQDTVRGKPAAAAAIAVALGGMATILGAWYFQYMLGYQPCALCLEQRMPYYAAIPLAVLAAVTALAEAPRQATRVGLGLIAIIMILGALLGLYHAGIEWKWWTGPLECSGTPGALGSAGNLLERVEATHIVRCDEAAWRFLGLSLAGWNVLISLALAGIATAGAVAHNPRGD